MLTKKRGQKERGHDCRRLRRSRLRAAGRAGFVAERMGRAAPGAPAGQGRARGLRPRRARRNRLRHRTQGSTQSQRQPRLRDPAQPLPLEQRARAAGGAWGPQGAARGPAFRAAGRPKQAWAGLGLPLPPVAQLCQREERGARRGSAGRPEQSRAGMRLEALPAAAALDGRAAPRPRWPRPDGAAAPAAPRGSLLIAHLRERGPGPRCPPRPRAEEAPASPPRADLQRPVLAWVPLRRGKPPPRAWQAGAAA